MTIAFARVVLKQHRFEVTTSALAGLAFAAWALLIQLRLNGMNVPTACLELWRQSGLAGARDCGQAMAGWGDLMAAEGVRLVASMAYLPFAIGLLAGVPIVAREIEARTAPTAWSLSGSRRRWLLRQLVPVAAVLGVAVALAAIGASAVQADREVWGEQAFPSIGLHGPLLVARAAGAFGVAVLLGALLGRSIPALVFGAALLIALSYGVAQVRDRWLTTIPPIPVSGERDMVTTGWAWRTPPGTLISDAEAKRLVPSDISSKDPPEQPIYSIEWLEARGYGLVEIGVDEQAALGWVPIEMTILTGGGALAIVAAALVIDRRRPT